VTGKLRRCGCSLYWTCTGCTEDYGCRLLPLCPHFYPHLKSLKPFNFNNSNQLMPDLRPVSAKSAR